MDVIVYGQLREATGSKTVHLDGAEGTVRDVLDRFLDAYPRATRHLLDGDGELRPSVRVMLDGDRVTLESECPPDAVLKVFPAMAGGCPPPGAAPRRPPGATIGHRPGVEGLQVVLGPDRLGEAALFEAVHRRQHR